jgi:hypothetical protein
VNSQHLFLGKIAEHYAQIYFLTNGYEVYETVVDDRGIDFVARKDGVFYEVQVKAVSHFGYTFIAKEKMQDLSPHRLVFYMNFKKDGTHDAYLIPATAWQTPSAVLTSKDYIEQKSRPEWGINMSQKNAHFLEEYKVAIAP